MEGSTTTQAKVSPDLEGLLFPIENLKEHPDNYRLGEVDEIAASLERFGQYRPIVVQEKTCYVLAGNHTLKAARQLGWDKIAIASIDVDDDEAKAILAADNRLSDKATNDDAALVAILEDLDSKGKLEGTGFVKADIEDVRAFADLGEEAGTVSEGESNATTEETERNWNRGEGGGTPEAPTKDYTLMVPAEEAEKFNGHVNSLKKKFGVSSMVGVVQAAVEYADEHYESAGEEATSGE